jgi:peptidoglycan/xylan/chitin deacetylase (PgdA/CDA1 family)
MFFSDWFGPSLRQGPPASSLPRVALTFDDGPSESTPAILDLLAEHKAQGTFFLVGKNVERLPAIARRYGQEGHEIGNHTWSHPNFYYRAPWQVRREIARCSQVIEDRLGARPRLFRPPFGVRWFGMFPALRRLAMRSVLWTVDGRDWKFPAAEIARRVLENPQDGDVILLHDGFRTHPGDHRRETAKALRTILESLRGRGVRCVTVSDLFGLSY